LELQLATAIDGEDVLLLVAVRRVAEQHLFLGICGQAFTAGTELVGMLKARNDTGLLAQAHRASEDAGWQQLAAAAEQASEELALVEATQCDDLAEIKAIERRAWRRNQPNFAAHAAQVAGRSANRVRERLGLPGAWDVVHTLAETEVSRLLRKSEEMEGELLLRVQQLVNTTFKGWGHDPRPRTRDRLRDPIATWLEVRSIVYVQNAESYLNYQARRLCVAAEMPSDALAGAAWDVKTSRIPLIGVGRHGSNPVNPAINEHYLWHGTSPEAAAGITDTEFALKRAGSAHGMLFGPGIYLTESCMKADEYTMPDARGFYPLVLCRAILGNIKYCDAPDPRRSIKSLEASCRPGGGYHSVLGDREKVRQTFREFVVYDSHQVYPEYIVWYVRH